MSHIHSTEKWQPRNTEHRDGFFEGSDFIHKNNSSSKNKTKMQFKKEEDHSANTKKRSRTVPLKETASAPLALPGGNSAAKATTTASVGPPSSVARIPPFRTVTWAKSSRVVALAVE